MELRYSSGAIDIKGRFSIPVNTLWVLLVHMWDVLTYTQQSRNSKNKVTQISYLKMQASRYLLLAMFSRGSDLCFHPRMLATSRYEVASQKKDSSRHKCQPVSLPGFHCKCLIGKNTTSSMANPSPQNSSLGVASAWRTCCWGIKV